MYSTLSNSDQLVYIIHKLHTLCAVIKIKPSGARVMDYRNGTPTFQPLITRALTTANIEVIVVNMEV